jgi:para-nitrobenzyl esterase
VDASQEVAAEPGDILRAIMFKAMLALSLASLAFGAVEDVKIASGRLKGAVTGSVVSWKGIPFAAPPVGQNRWRPPQPVAPWRNVRAATAFGADCMQNPFPGDAAPLGVAPAEDCLYVNVWSPVKRSGKLPVMVWIYGGGFVNGGSSPAVYDGSKFAESGVVLVSFNYRLGRFGFFAHPALTEFEGSGPLGNYAFMDQIAALEWVKKNVSAFGGDPSNVTIFGESAGGMSVFALLTTPAARGLFHKAIIESGGGRNLLGQMRHIREARAGTVPGEQVGIAFAKKNGIEGTGAAALAALRALPVDQVVDKMNMMTMNNPTYSGPMIDGKIVVEPVQDALLGGRVAKVPVMIGANSNEFGFLFARTWDDLMRPFGSDRAKAEAAYDPQGRKDLKATAMVIGADQFFVEPARFAARQIRAAGQPAYLYRFSYVAESMRKEWKGAPHATEIPFVFNTIAARYGDKLTPDDRKAAETAHAYWVAFARKGNPNGEGRPEWPVYERTEDRLMNFTNEGPIAQRDPLNDRLDLVEKFAGQ